MRRSGNKEKVLDHFRKYKAITTMDAFELYGMTRLSAVIHNLKKESYIFDEEWVEVETRYGNKVKVKSYILVGKENA